MLTKGKAQPLERPRRFYKTVTTGESGTGFDVRLDGRPVRTPLGTVMVLPTLALAELVAADWAAQGEWIALADMPATRLAFTALDAIGAARQTTAAEVGRYAGSDMLCYFAESPAALVERQLAQWGPVLDWAEGALGLRLERTAGIVHLPQPPQTIEAVVALALRLDDFALAGLAHAAGLFGSAVVALALERDKLDGATAHELARLDEAYQEEGWGIDAEAAERTERRRQEAVMLERWFTALKG